MIKKRTNDTQDFDRKRIVRFKKDCAFCKNEGLDIDYKNIELLSRYVSSRGKILSRRINGNCAKHQRKVAREVKLARFMNLIPYVGRPHT
jgi:small subunit ribosomal protein S18